jgi:tetratricopeptide (TPR) repeat protein/tRNA A-37 threonylcarbamoyl transferase component Bud32
MADTHPDLLVDELAEEFARRYRSGERPSITEYAARYPDLADEIRDVFAGVVMLEQLKPSSHDTHHQSPAMPAHIRAPERLGEYRILRELGRGGMGVVYEAVQESLNRRVALKVLPAHLLANERLRSRFLRESQATGRLHHTNIVPVFGVGEADGLCFYVMQLITGRGLDEIIRTLAADDDQIDLPEFTPARLPHTVAQLGLQVAEALAYAHSQGIVHRDIKPSNLILDERGTVWITDFGVAKVFEESNLTQSGDLVGTLKYMPPERFAGKSDARGDVYSLGITLYELLTLSSAFPETNPQHLIQLIMLTGPPPLRKVKPRLPTDLEIILEKATTLNPGQRYQSAAELSEDLRRFLDDRPIRARRIGPLQQAWRWCRRNRAVTASAAAAFLMMIAVTAISITAYVRTAAAHRETAGANAEMRKALAAEQAQRTHAEKTSALALEALNRIYERFGANRLVATASSTISNGLGESVELPQQPALLPEAVPLLEDLLRTYEQIASNSAQFASLQAQAAEANHRIGDIRQRLGQLDAAAAAYQKAIHSYSVLLSDQDDATVRLKLVRSINELGHAQRSLPDLDRSRRTHDRALQLLGEASPEAASQPEFRYELARTIYLQEQFDFLAGPRGGPGPERRPPPDGPGQPPPKPGDFLMTPLPGPPLNERGAQQMRRAVRILEELKEQHPNVPEYRHLLACCYRDAPPEFRGRGPLEPFPQLDQAIELLRQLSRDFPRSPDYRFDLCETLARSAGPVGPSPGFTRPQPKIAERLTEAVTLSEELAAQYPGVPQYAAARAQYLDRLGIMHFNNRQFAPAETTGRHALAIQTQLVARYPDVLPYRLWLSLMECSLGRALREQGQLTEARAQVDSALQRLEELRNKDPRLGALRPILGMAYRELAQVQERAGEKEAAAESQRKAEAFGPQRPPSFPNPRERPEPRP